jgi:pyruvate ferredoxin oxidoreductase alpha subunit
MPKRVGIEVSVAVAEAVAAADCDVIAAYPITPQTHIVESISEMVAEGELDAEYICVESEHSAMSACLGSAAAGARTFTATAGQGLELMHEVVFVAASMRLPIVMAVANRAVSSPLSVWGDHSDAMAVRDTGWIQIFVENGQEAFDQTLWAFRVAEDPEALLPVMVHLDGFHLTHMVEPLEVLSREEVAKYLPPFNYNFKLDPRQPVTMGAFGPPDIYMETRRALDQAIIDSKKVILKAWDEFAELYGRRYRPVETFMMDGAETALLTMGSFSETASLAVENLRAEGVNVGQVRFRLWRPFPVEELRDALKDVKRLIVLDRSISLGGQGGPVAGEIRSVMHGCREDLHIVSFVGGLGGRSISVKGFEEIIRRGMGDSACGYGPVQYEMIGLRE